MAQFNLGATSLYIFGMLLSGTVNTLTTKIQFTMNSIGKNGEVETFSKPWFGTLNMLMAMFFVLVVEQMLSGFSLCRSQMGKSKPLLMDASPIGQAQVETLTPKPSKTWCQKVLLVAIPAGLDLLATACSCIGIMYIPASVWQMLKGSALIFCAILSIFFLKRKMYAFNWLGIFLCVVGIASVGLANVLGAKGEDASGQKDIGTLLFGMALTLFGQIVQAAQVIAEEWLMKDVDLPSVQIIGFEGLWGILMMLLVVYPVLWILPGSDGGHAEDPVDTIVMVWNSGPLMCCVVTYLISCGTFNITGIQVTAALSAVHRMMMDASRTMVIWAFGLYVHYQVSPTSKFGESWNDYSCMQLVGFVVLVVGQAIYGGVLKLPILSYPTLPPADPTEFTSPAASMMLASPLPREA
jgi:drug/metabolite transporter (DMT)-like permease